MNLDDLTQEGIQRENFRNILISLAGSQDLLRDKTERKRVYIQLENLYHNSSGLELYRHFYSDIFLVLTQIKQGDYPGSIDVLGQNMSEIRKGYQPLNQDDSGEPIDISSSVRKLYDHVSLEIARITYSEAMYRQFSGKSAVDNLQAQGNSIETKITQAAARIESAEKRLKSAEERLSGVQKEYITILGIFASVVLSFTAGITFSNSVFQNIDKASIYRTVFIVVLIGLVLTNILFGLFYYLDRLVHDVAERKIKPLCISNIVLILVLAATAGCWYFGEVETRNVKVKHQVDVVNTEANNSSTEIDNGANEANIPIKE